LAIRKSELKTD